MVNGGEILISLVINCLVIYILHILHKRSISKTIENVRKEVYELENLVSAIIEEFEEVADGVLKFEIEQSDDRPVIDKGKIEKSIEEPIETAKEKLTVTEEQKKGESLDADFDKPSSDYSKINFEGTPETIPMFQPHEIMDPRHNRILQLWKDGLAIEEIAKQLGTGRGEVQLILGIYKRG